MLNRSIPIEFSHKKLSINTPQDIHKKLSIDPQKDDLQETIAILFILSSSRSLNPFLGHLTHF